MAGIAVLLPKVPTLLLTEASVIAPVLASVASLDKDTGA
jgi:hypothetical protein